MIGEPKPQASSDTSERDQYEANTGRLAELSSKNVGELSDDELEAMVAERKALKLSQSENIGRAQEEANAENAERDAEKARRATEAKVAEDVARAEQVAKHEAIAVEDAAKAVALAEQIKNGTLEQEPVASESNAQEQEIAHRLEYAAKAGAAIVEARRRQPVDSSKISPEGTGKLIEYDILRGDLDTFLNRRQGSEGTSSENEAILVALQERMAELASDPEVLGNIQKKAEREDTIIDDEKARAFFLQLNQASQALRGEAEISLSEGDIAAFQATYTKMQENEIAKLEYRIRKSDEDFSNGNYQENFISVHGKRSPDYIQDVYEYQKKTLAQEIKTCEDFIEMVQDDPQRVIIREKFDEKLDKVGALMGMLKEVSKTLAWEKKEGYKKGTSAWSPMAKLEGAVTAALRYKNPETMAFLKKTFGGDLPMTNAVLSPELQQQIHDLKV